MRRRFIDRILVILGSGLICAGWYALTYFDAVAGYVGGRLGIRTVTCAMNTILSCGVMLGYLGVGVGALLVATGIGLPPPPAAPEIAPRASAHPRRGALALLLIAAALAALGSGLSIRTQPGMWPLVLWLATFLLPIAAMISIDRGRGTPFGNPFPRRWEWALLLLIVALDLVLVGHDMTHWRWAGTPDETGFYGVAKSIAVGISERPLLSEGGVFEFQPVLSSYYPALFMMLFGVNAFAWKLSSAVALAGALPGVYLFTRQLWNRRAALMAALFFGCAQMAVGFSHFGYNNVQVYLIVGGALGVLAWAHTRQSLLGYYLAGCIAGLGFYTYYTARAVAPLLLLLIWSGDGFPLGRTARRQTAALVFGLGLTILPIFSDLSTALQNMLKLAVSSGQASTLGEGVSRMMTHWFLSIVHGLWYPGPHHFQSNPIIDPISGTLAVVGLWLCIFGWHRANGRSLALAYLLVAFLAGATSQHYRPPLTRLLILAPLTAILAAVGADQLLRVRSARQWRTHVAAAVLVAASMAWNIATVAYNVRYKHHGYGDGTTSELIRIAQQLPPQCRIILIQLSDPRAGMVSNVLEEYGMDERFIDRQAVDAETIELLRTTPPPFAVFTDIADAPQMAEIEAAMARRYPAGVWRASDPGQPWNLRYFEVSGAGLSPSF